MGTSAVFFLGLSLGMSFPPASMTSLAMASAYYRFGGWRSSRMGVADAKAAVAASA